MYLKNICVTGQQHKRIGMVCQVSGEVWNSANGRFHVACIAEGRGGYSHTYSYMGARLMTKVVCEYFAKYENLMWCFENNDFRKFKEDVAYLWEQEVLAHYNKLSPGNLLKKDYQEVVRRYSSDYIIGLFCEEQLYVIKTKNMNMFFSQDNKIMDFRRNHVLQGKYRMEKYNNLDWEVSQLDLSDTKYVLLCTQGVIHAFPNQFRMFHFLDGLHEIKETDIKRIESIGRIGMEEDIGVILWRNENADVTNS